MGHATTRTGATEGPEPPGPAPRGPRPRHQVSQSTEAASQSTTPPAGHRTSEGIARGRNAPQGRTEPQGGSGRQQVHRRQSPHGDEGHHQDHPSASPESGPASGRQDATRAAPRLAVGYRRHHRPPARHRTAYRGGGGHQVHPDQTRRHSVMVTLSTRHRDWHQVHAVITTWISRPPDRREATCA